MEWSGGTGAVARFVGRRYSASASKVASREPPRNPAPAEYAAVRMFGRPLLTLVNVTFALAAGYFV